MSQHGHGDAESDDEVEFEGAELDPVEYATLVELERLESLEEEMMELAVMTLDEVRARIAALHKELDARE